MINNNIAVLGVVVVAILLLFLWLLSSLFQVLKQFFGLLFRRRPESEERESEELGLVDYEKAFHILLKRPSKTPQDFAEEKAFFVSLINRAITVDELKAFVENISIFCEDKLNKIPKLKTKEQIDIYTQNYSSIGQYIVSLIKDRFDLINRLDEAVTPPEFISLIDSSLNTGHIDALLVFARKFGSAEYLKIKRIADKKKEYLATRNGTEYQQPKPRTVRSSKRTKPVKPASLGGLIFVMLKSVFVAYALLVLVAFLLNSLAPIVATARDHPLLHVRNFLNMKVPYLPKFAKKGVYVVTEDNRRFLQRYIN